MKRITLMTVGLLVLVLLVAACSPAAQDTQLPTQPAAQTQPQQPTAYPPAATTDSANAAASPYPAATDAPAATSAAYPAATQASSGAPAGEIQFVLVPDQSEARFRVREQLAGKDLPNDAVGATKQVTGVVYLKPDGTIDTSQSKFVVQAGTLATDQSMRDGFVRRNILQTDRYPEVVFVPTSLSGLPNPLPSSGQVTFKLTGQLTIRDVTKEVTWDVTGSIDGGTAKGTATTAFKFEDFNLQQPRVPVVLSIEDNIKLEFDVTMQKAGN
jgi:polyisoprenoid-binding protein YceI